MPTEDSLAIIGISLGILVVSAILVFLAWRAARRWWQRLPILLIGAAALTYGIMMFSVGLYHAVDVDLTEGAVEPPSKPQKCYQYRDGELREIPCPTGTPRPGSR
jgi:hypothetical protein